MPQFSMFILFRRKGYSVLMIPIVMTQQFFVFITLPRRGHQQGNEPSPLTTLHSCQMDKFSLWNGRTRSQHTISRTDFIRKPREAIYMQRIRKLRKSIVTGSYKVFWKRFKHIMLTDWKFVYTRHYTSFFVTIFCYVNRVHKVFME